MLSNDLPRRDEFNLGFQLGSEGVPASLSEQSIHCRHVAQKTLEKSTPSLMSPRMVASVMRRNAVRRNVWKRVTYPQFNGKIIVILLLLVVKEEAVASIKVSTWRE